MVVLLHLLLHAAVVIVNGDAEHFLGVLLADDVVFEVPENLSRARHVQPRQRRERLLLFITEFLVEDVFADADAGIADVHARAGDELADFGMTLSAERAHGDVSGAGHEEWGRMGGK